MSLKIDDVTPEGEAKIIDFLDKVFSKDNEADDLRSMDEVDFGHHDLDILPDCNPDVIMNRKDSYIRASNCALEYYRQSDMYSIFACPVTKEQIKAAFLSFYRGDGEFLRDIEWHQMTLFPKKDSGKIENYHFTKKVKSFWSDLKDFFIFWGGVVLLIPLLLVALFCILFLGGVILLIPLLLIFGVFYILFCIVKAIFPV